MAESDHALLARIDERVGKLDEQIKDMNNRLFGNGRRGYVSDFDRRLHKLEVVRPYFAGLIAFGLTAGGAVGAVLLPRVVAWLGK